MKDSPTLLVLQITTRIAYATAGQTAFISLFEFFVTQPSVYK